MSETTVKQQRAAVVEGEGKLWEGSVSFWGHPFVQNFLPFLTSAVLHFGVLAMGYLIWKVVDRVGGPVVMEAQTLAPENEVGRLGGRDLYRGVGDDPERAFKQNEMAEVPVDSGGVSSQAGAGALTSMGAGGDVLDQVMSTGRERVLAGVGDGGEGDGKSGDGSGSGGMAAPYGPPGGGGTDPVIRMFRLDPEVKKVAYVCDASGSMLSKFDSLRLEIRKSVGGLRPSQAFNVIFFQGTSALCLDEKSLVLGTEAHKKAAGDFVDGISPQDSTDPIPALRVAFAEGPQVIFLLTDGDFPDNQGVVDFIKANHGSCKVNCIAYIDHGETYEKVMREISEMTGGTFKFVSEDDLGR